MAKTAVDFVQGLHYKLQMMGIEVMGPAYTYCDNKSIVHNAMQPESTLK